MKFPANGKEWVALLWKERYIIAGAVALLSLGLLIFYYSTPEHKESLAKERLDKIARLIRHGSLNQANEALGDFLHVHADAKQEQKGRAHLLRADVHVTRCENEGTIDLLRYETITHNLDRAAAFGVKGKDFDALQWRVAGILAKRGFIREAAARYRAIAADPKNYPALLELALLQGREGMIAQEEDLDWTTRDEKPVAPAADKPYDLQEGLRFVEEYRRTAPESERERGDVAAAGLLVDFHCDEEALALLDRLTAPDRPAAVRVPALVERGRLMFLRRRFPEAIGNLDEAKKEEDLLRKDKSLDDVNYLLAEACRMVGDRRAIELDERLISTGSRNAPVARISLGRFYAGTGEQDPIVYFIAGLDAPGLNELFRRVGLDLPAFYRELNRLWNTAKDEDVLRYLKVLERLAAIYPKEETFIEGQGLVFQRAADAGRRKARTLRGQDPAGADREDAAADGRYLNAGMKFEEITRRKMMSTERLVAAHRRSAELFREGKFYSKSAEHYGAIAVLLPLEKRSSRFLEAGVLREGGILSTGDAAHPGALEVYTACIDWEMPADEISRESMLARGEVLMDLERNEQAAAVFRQFIDDREGRFGLTPEAEPWKRALYLHGLCRLREALASREEDPVRSKSALGEARKSFVIFLDRYADPNPHRLCMAAAYDLGRCFSEERDHARALEAYRRAVQLGAARESTMTPADADMLKRAAFSVADTLFHLDRYAEAAAAYEDAQRRYAASKDRLWGLIGLARCKAGMGKKDEALDHLEGARNLLRDYRAAFEESPAGFGVDFWNSMIRDVEMAVRKL